MTALSRENLERAVFFEQIVKQTDGAAPIDT